MVAHCTTYIVGRYLFELQGRRSLCSIALLRRLSSTRSTDPPAVHHGPTVAPPCDPVMLLSVAGAWTLHNLVPAAVQSSKTNWPNRKTEKEPLERVAALNQLDVSNGMRPLMSTPSSPWPTDTQATNLRLGVSIRRRSPYRRSSSTAHHCQKHLVFVRHILGRRATRSAMNWCHRLLLKPRAANPSPAGWTPTVLGT